MIETPSDRLRWTARLCGRLPPIVSGRLVSLLYPRPFAERQNAAFRVRGSLGPVTFSFPRFERIATSFAMRGYYEWRNVVIANTLCRAGDTILDVGANLGTETVYFALIAGRRGRVVAFEPMPDNHAFLADLLRVNGLTNVDLYPHAVANERSHARFYLPSVDSNMGTGSLTTSAQVGRATVDVQVVTLDALHADGVFRAPRLLVMDVEGYESEVLQGGEQMIRDERPAIITEIARPVLEGRGSSPAAMREQLEKLGYRCWQIARYGLSQPRLEDRLANWLCLPAAAESAASRVHRALRRAALMPLIQGLNPAVVGPMRD